MAGCTAMARETHLTPEEPIEHGTSLVLPFTENGEDVLRLQLDKQFTDEKARSYYPFFISTLQPAGDDIKSLTLQFRSPAHPLSDSPAGIALRDDAHAYKAELLQDNDDPSTTILSLPDISEIGQASVRLNLLLERDHEQDPQELWIGVSADLSSEGLVGTHYRASGELTVAFP